MLVLVEGGKLENLEKNSHSKVKPSTNREPTCDTDWNRNSGTHWTYADFARATCLARSLLASAEADKWISTMSYLFQRERPYSLVHY